VGMLHGRELPPQRGLDGLGRERRCQCRRAALRAGRAIASRPTVAPGAAVEALAEHRLQAPCGGGDIRLLGGDGIHLGVGQALLLEQGAQAFVLIDDSSRGCLDLARGFHADLLAAAVLRLQLLEILLAAGARTPLVVPDAGQVGGTLGRHDPVSAQQATVMQRQRSPGPVSGRGRPRRRCRRCSASAAWRRGNRLLMNRAVAGVGAQANGAGGAMASIASFLIVVAKAGADLTNAAGVVGGMEISDHRSKPDCAFAEVDAQPPRNGP
jgi:hypothetical protein